MIYRATSIGIVGLAAACSLFADFSYEQTSTITGGAIAGMMQIAGAFNKQMREPTKSTVMVKGNRMVHISANHTSIIDVDQETITQIDMQKKTYSVMTFAQMKEMMEQMAQKMKSKDGEASFKISAENTGKTRKISGLDAKEIILTMDLEGTDKKSGQTGTVMRVTTDTWLASGIAGYDEVREFHKRMAQKLAWTPGGGMMMGRPDIAKGMAEAAKEMAKLDGVPVLSLMKMGGAGGPAAGQTQLTPEQQAQVAQAQQQADQARQQAAQQQQQQQQQQPSTGSVLGGALGGRLGRFGGLGRNKKEQPKQDQAQSTPPPAASSATPAQPSDPSSLMEMTTEMTNFGSGPVDASKFEVPAGFKKVEPDTRRGR